MLDREALIREIAAHNGMRGFDVSPLERDKILDFTTKLSSLSVQQTAEVDRIQVRLTRAGSYSYPALTIMLQNETLQSNATYNEKSRQLHASLERYKQQRANNRTRIVCVLHVILGPFLTPSLGEATIGHYVIRD
jgi:hypothetical protein